MPNSGKWLEQLVADIEKDLLPHTFSVTTNEKIFDTAGVQIAEFDIVIEGNLGSTSIRWLIECRDRPSDGAAPGEWILGLIGRRDFYQFDRVTAVSTTGFSPAAVEYAKGKNIDLRTVDKITPKSVSDWFGPKEFAMIGCYSNVIHAEILLDGNAAQSTAASAIAKVTSLKAGTPFLIHANTGKTINIVEAWQVVLNGNIGLLQEVEANGKTDRLIVQANYNTPDGRYQIVTESGQVDIVQIIFHVDISINSKEVPISQIVQYTKTADQKPVAQSVRFELDAGDKSFDLAFRNFGDNDKTLIRIRARDEGKTQGRG